MGKIEHTPLPWHEGETRAFAGVEWDCIIRNGKNDPIVSVGFSGWDKKTCRANAAFIVTACNSYYDLQQRNAALATNLKQLIQYFEWQLKEGSEYHPTLPSAVGQAKSALAANGGGDV